MSVTVESVVSYLLVYGCFLSDKMFLLCVPLCDCSVMTLWMHFVQDISFRGLKSRSHRFIFAHSYSWLLLLFAL